MINWKRQRSKKLIRNGAFLPCLLLLFILTACTGKKEEETQTATQAANPADTMITLYHVEGNEIVPDEEIYQLRQPDSISNSLDELVAAQQMPEEMKYNSFSLDEYNNVTVSVNVTSDITQEALLLNKAAIVSTLGQIEEIQSIEIVVCSLTGDILEDSYYTMDSFFFYDNTSALKNSGTVCIYLPNDEGTALRQIEEKVVIDPDESVEQCVTERLISYGALPAGTKIRNIYVEDHTCYLDLSAEFLNGNGSVKSEVVIYSVVNSLTELPNIENVQILVEGEKRELYRESVAIDGLLEYKGGLID